MKHDLSSVGDGGWTCAACGCPLERLLIDITYMGSGFQVELPRCPQCGYTYIPPDLAEGKMLEAERILEDK